MIEICIVGAGKIFQLYHLKSINLIKSIKIKYVVDKNFELAKRVASAINAIPYESLDEIINCEIFFVTVPPKFRIEVFDSIKDHAKNIIFEKPITLTYSDADYIRNISEEKGINILVAQTRRFFPNINFTKKILAKIKTKKIKITAFEGALFNWASESDYFSNQNPNDHGVFHDVGSHIFDYIIYIIGSITKIEKLEFQVIQSIFDYNQNANNTYSKVKIFNKNFEFEIIVRISRSSNFSNMIIINDGNNRYLTRSLMARDIKMVTADEIIKIPIPKIKPSFDLNDVFYNMWLDIENVLKTNSSNNSKISLNSVIQTSRLMQEIIDKMKIDNNLQDTYYE
tara:strand:- start:3033 stop:4052 length:1020 start_codon:yes stop_codon:yes gene_type:complete